MPHPADVLTLSSQASPGLLSTRADGATARRFAVSAAATEGVGPRTDEVAAWLDGHRRATAFRVDRIPFAELDGWYFEKDTGNLVHRSGRFFTVEGLRVSAGENPAQVWHQPIIRQPEVGILGILAKEFDGVLHFLMQAKMEPGNPNLLQLSPTVQATRSNYTRVHRGGDVKYVEYFTRPDRGRVLADVLQSEHGSWFYRKNNRNMIVEVTDDIPEDPRFCWLTLGQIGALLRRDNTVNMDARTVLSCLPFADGEPQALHSDVEVLSWMAGERARHQVSAELEPLSGIPDWTRNERTIEHDQGRYFRVVAVAVEAGNREVTSWSQPLFEPVGLGVTAFLTRRINGVRHVLVHARVEGGFRYPVEIGPTVQCVPGNHAHLSPGERPPFLDAVVSAGPGQILYEAVHSEEGGRFINAESRYLLVDADESDAPLTPPEGFRWLTLGQLRTLVQHSNYINVQARTLLACFLAVPA
ncbi:NDP-hexose 2,3-dehydratase family protein [Streptomyces sp. Je 1-79]|uniref:NDP-hexose 2,3-dehydratase family protein n=1 Tax=Streptomyces sp. Je 1-79 TaxID=2943847 RepID=UPI0021A5BA72|nr:NDP-hexose 2,3-dehydratase family protein [Streptomyces sp. Je 1-79]MCT4356204.1 NDP-hexose 2,3-dehydratase family protein [Streptomyces sp. Je 1-79]